jgi:hypothetical protein
MKEEEFERRSALMRARSKAVEPVKESTGVASRFVKHLTVNQVAERLGMSTDWVRNHFRSVVGVVVIPSPRKRSTRPYSTLLIPEDVYEGELKKHIMRTR